MTKYVLNSGGLSNNPKRAKEGDFIVIEKWQAPTMLWRVEWLV